MSVTTGNLQQAGGDDFRPIKDRYLGSGRYGYSFAPEIADVSDLQCGNCCRFPESGNEPRIVYSGYGPKADLCLCAKCADQLTASLIQDLARVIEVEGFVAGRYMAQRQERIVKDFEDIMLAGKVQLPPGWQ
jgi:hypothetical protein